MALRTFFGEVAHYNNVNISEKFMLKKVFLFFNLFQFFFFLN